MTFKIAAGIYTVPVDGVAFHTAIIESCTAWNRKMPRKTFNLIHANVFIWNRPFYLHYKGGIYEYLLTAKDCETQEPLTIYRHWWPHEEDNWARKRNEFFSNNDKNEARFRKFYTHMLVHPELMDELKTFLED